MARGTVGALIAAVPGFVDLISMSRGRGSLRDKSLASDQRLARATEPVWLSVVGVLLLGVSGWLGGELTYVHGVEVERSE